MRTTQTSIPNLHMSAHICALHLYAHVYNPLTHAYTQTDICRRQTWRCSCSLCYCPPLLGQTQGTHSHCIRVRACASLLLITRQAVRTLFCSLPQQCNKTVAVTTRRVLRFFLPSPACVVTPLCGGGANGVIEPALCDGFLVSWQQRCDE